MDGWMDGWRSLQRAPACLLPTGRRLRRDHLATVGYCRWGLHALLSMDLTLVLSSDCCFLPCSSRRAEIIVSNDALHAVEQRADRQEKQEKRRHPPPPSFYLHCLSPCPPYIFSWMQVTRRMIPRSLPFAFGHYPFIGWLAWQSAKRSKRVIQGVYSASYIVVYGITPLLDRLMKQGSLHCILANHALQPWRCQLPHTWIMALKPSLPWDTHN
jgi:hypothetical protein